MLVGELSIVAECLRQLEICQPWANGFEDAYCSNENEIQPGFALRTTYIVEVLEALWDANLIDISTFGDPSDKKFDYPVSKRRSKEIVEKLRAAENNLDIFWSKVDDHWNGRLKYRGVTGLKLLSIKPRLLQRTPEWSDQHIQKPEMKSRQELNPYTSTFANLQLISGTSSGLKEVIAASVPKSKVKFRGNSSSDLSDGMPAVMHPICASEEKQPVFRVDKRALKVFRVLFFDLDANTSPGELPWADFLHALGCTGFSSQKLYGSVWHFEPSRLDVERSIKFHEPHPHKKIPLLISRWHGRRFHRAYGWIGSMFFRIIKVKERRRDFTSVNNYFTRCVGLKSTHHTNGR